MKLATAREAYYTFTGKASDLVRQLAFAGIAVVWLYRAARGDVGTIPPNLRAPLILCVLALLFDLLQYVSSALAWGAYARSQETRGVDEETEFDAPAWLNWPGNTFYAAKVLTLAAAYALLLRFLARELFQDAPA